MNIKATAINLFANQIIGGREFGAAKDIVSTLQAKDIPNEEKRQLAVERLKTLGYALAGFLLNLAIELAVAYFKSQVQDKS
jgi:ligand-binding sensor domain-containing protein